MSNIENMIATISKTGTDFQMQYVMVDGDPWFRGREVGELLGYTNTKKAIIDHVRDKYKRKLEELRGNETLPLDYNTRNTVFINEAGLYSLILRSHQEQAIAFQDWVVEEVLPSIRKTGAYAIAQEPPALPPPSPQPSAIAQLNIIDQDKIKKNNYINLYNEKELHIKVVQYVRRFHPEAVMMAGLGEFQETHSQRIEGKMKGYQKGCCDLMILNNHMEYKGLCIELKNPRGTGDVKPEQLKWLTDMHLNGHKVILSNDYDEIVREICDYFMRVRLVCPYCAAKPQYFKTSVSLDRHLSKFHHNIKKNPIEV
jgi:prophage antirepressor-like protein